MRRLLKSLWFWTFAAFLLAGADGLLLILAQKIPLHETAMTADSYNGSSDDKQISTPFRLPSLPASCKENKRIVELSFDFKTEKATGWENLFQTSSGNKGLRAEIDGGLNLGVVSTKNDSVFGIQLGHVEAGKWQRLKLALDINNSSVKAWLFDAEKGVAMEPQTGEDLTLTMDSIMVGTGFSATRPFSGQIRDFKLTCLDYWNVPHIFINALLAILSIAIALALAAAVSARRIEKSPIPYSLAFFGLALALCVPIALAPLIPIARFAANAEPYNNDSSAAGKEISKPNKLPSPPPCPANARRFIDISFDFKAGEVKSWDNLFQTSSANNGIRAEIDGGYNLGVVSTKDDNVYGIRMGTVAPGKWYGFRISADNDEGIVKVWLKNDGNLKGRAVLPQTDVGFDLSTDDVMAGTGFSGTRPFHGQMKDFVFSCRDYWVVPQEYRFFAFSLLAIALSVLCGALAFKSKSSWSLFVLAFAGLFSLLFADSVRIPLQGFSKKVESFSSETENGQPASPVRFDIPSWNPDIYSTDLDLSLSFKPSEFVQFQNIFQTGRENKGLRVEMSTTGGCTLLLGSDKTEHDGFEVAPFAEASLTEWKSVRVLIKDKHLKIWSSDGMSHGDAPILSEMRPELNIINGSGAIGTGFSCTRPFHGEIKNFSLSCTPHLVLFNAFFWQLFGGLLFGFAVALAAGRSWTREKDGFGGFNIAGFLLSPLIAAWAIMLLVSTNSGTATGLTGVASCFAFCLAFSLLSWGAFTLLFKDFTTASAVSAVFVGLSLVFGHFYDALSSLKFLSFLQLDERLALFLLAVLASIALASILKAGRAALPAVFKWSACIIALLVALNLCVSGWKTLQQNKRTQVSAAAESRKEAVKAAKGPDIYQLLLDAYPNNWTLKNCYDFDNTPFLEELKKRGFFIATKSASNYAYTNVSVPSMANMDYLEENMPPSLVDLKFQHGDAYSFVMAKGYKFVYIRTYAQVLPPPDAAIVVENISDLQFAKQLLAGSIARPFFNFNMTSQQSVLAALSSLPKVASSIPGPKFVFTHILCPHPPFLFDKEGKLPTPPQPECFPHDNGALRINKQAFIDQLQYVNKITLKTIDAILEKSPTPPVIVLHGDHSLYLDLTPAEMGGDVLPSETVLKARMRILNAFLLPGAKAGDVVYDSITPVNDFRMIFNHYLNGKFKRLPDRHYYSSVHNITKFSDVTDIVKFNDAETP